MVPLVFCPHFLFHLHCIFQIRSLLALFIFSCPWPVAHQFLYEYIWSPPVLLSIIPCHSLSWHLLAHLTLFLLFHWYGIIYWLWVLVILILCTVSTWDLLQNSSTCLLLCYLCSFLLEYFASSFSTLSYNLWQCILFFHTHSIFEYLSSFFNFLQSLAICLYISQLKHFSSPSLKFSFDFPISMGKPHSPYVIPIPIQ